LYAVFASSFICIFSLLKEQEYDRVVLFIVISLLLYRQLTKNMIYVLGIPLSAISLYTLIHDPVEDEEEEEKVEVDEENKNSNKEGYLDENTQEQRERERELTSEMLDCLQQGHSYDVCKKYSYT
jgi:hypothetical protein